MEDFVHLQFVEIFISEWYQMEISTLQDSLRYLSTINTELIADNIIVISKRSARQLN